MRHVQKLLIFCTVCVKIGVDGFLAGLPSFYYLPPTCPCSHATCTPNLEPLPELSELEHHQHNQPPKNKGCQEVRHHLQPNVWNTQQNSNCGNSCGPLSLNLCICNNNNPSNERFQPSHTNNINHGHQLPTISYLKPKHLTFLPDLNNWKHKLPDEDEENSIHQEIPPSYSIERNRDY